MDKVFARFEAGENRDKEPVEDEKVLIRSVGSEKKKRRRDKPPRSGCKFRIYVINRRNTRHWEITSLELNHNHDIVWPSKMNLIKRDRHVTAAQKNLIKSFHISDIAPRQQMNIFGKMHGGEEQVGFHIQHLRNVVRDFRKDNLGVNDAQAGLDLLHRLEEESGEFFFIRTLIDEEGRLKCLLWVDPWSLLAYKNFGDVVAFDTIYRINRYAMPFVPFTGVNHHYQSVLFEFALMLDELKTTFEGVLGTWLEVIEGKAPLAIITDQDQAMAGEIQSQLPNTTLLCSWHISNKFPEKLSTYYAKEEFKGDFNNCIYHSLTEEISEDRWTRDANRVDGVLPYHMPGDDALSHHLTPTEIFNHMTLLTMGFSHSCMASKERYEYAVRVIYRETEIIEKMPVHGMEGVGSEFDTKITQETGEKLHEIIPDPVVSKTNGRKKEHRIKSPVEELAKQKRKCGYCNIEGHDARKCLVKLEELKKSQSEMTNTSDDESVSHVSNTFSDSGSEFEDCMSPTFSELDVIAREWSEGLERFNEGPLVEEEDPKLHPPEEEAYRSRVWAEACHWILDIRKLKPRGGATRDQVRIDHVKGWVSHLRGDDTTVWAWVKHHSRHNME
ncbi:hypothetical protein AgCh_000625 [Apium graveolens]